MSKKLRNASLVFFALIGVLLIGCSAYPETEADFGNSVRQMVRSQQIYTGPVDPNPVEGADGQRVEAVLQTYRENVSQPSEVDDPVEFAGGTQ